MCSRKVAPSYYRVRRRGQGIFSQTCETWQAPPSRQVEVLPDTTPSTLLQRQAYSATLATLARQQALLGRFVPRHAGALAAAVLWRRAMCLAGFTAVELQPLTATRPAAPRAHQLCVDLGELGTAAIARVPTTHAWCPPMASEAPLGLAAWMWDMVTPASHRDAWAWLAALGCEPTRLVVAQSRSRRATPARGVSLPAWLPATRRRFTHKYIRLSAALCNAACGAPANSEALPLALAALESAATPRAFVQSVAGQRLQVLQQASVAAWRLLQQGLVPLFCGRLLVLEMATPWQLEQQVLAFAQQQWPQHLILVGNAVQERVHYVLSCHGPMRTADYLSSLGWAAMTAPVGCMPRAAWCQHLQSLRLQSVLTT